MAADILPFGQLACSSPHAVYWLGGADKLNDVFRGFESELEAVIAGRQNEPDLVWAVRRMKAAFAQAAAGRISEVKLNPNTSNLIATAPGLAEQTDPCGAGLLVHTSCSSV